MSGRGHRKLRLCSRKKYERKKYQHPPAIPVQPVPLPDVSILTVSVPLDLLPLRVSLPLSALEAAPAGSTRCLRDRLERLGTLRSRDSTCNGPDLRKIVRVLKEVTEWEILSLLLDVESRVRNWIKDDCLRQKNVATCYRMELVQHYCDKTDRSLRQVANDMADVLDRMDMKKQADKLRLLTFTGSADRHPPSLSDSDPLEGYWVSIAVALALIAVTTFIYQIYTRSTQELGHFLEYPLLEYKSRPVNEQRLAREIEHKYILKRN